MQRNKWILQVLSFTITLLTVFGLIGFNQIYASNCCKNDTPDGSWWKGCCSGDGSSCCSSAGEGCTLIPCEGCPPEGGGGGGKEEKEDPPPPCERCTLPACPLPLVEVGDDDYKLNNFLKCTDKGGCSKPIDHYKACYEVPSNPPTPLLVIDPDGEANEYGFTSFTHTGNILLSEAVNEPIEMIAKYTDRDSGSSSIEAMYVWFSQNGKPTTPELISLDPSLKGVIDSTSEFGFMMRRVNSNWIPYVVHMGITNYWVSTEYKNNTFYINGSDSKSIIKIDILGITEYSNEDRIELKFKVSFTKHTLQVSDGVYRGYVMANDTFGFTPYDNYDAYPEVKAKIPNYYAPNQIRYFNSWEDSKKDWIVDLTAPSIDASVNVVGPYTLRLKWNISDNMGIKYLVGNMYLTDSYDETQLDNFNIVVSSSKTYESISPYIPVKVGEASDKPGYIKNGYFFRLEGDGTQWSSTNISEYVDINVGENRHGVITLYLTAFDNAGNPAIISGNASGGNLNFDLRDWYATKGGLFYSVLGIDFSPKVIEDDAINPWDGISPILGITPQEADISTELVGFGNSQSSSTPLKSEYTKSYMVSPFEGTKKSSYYEYFNNAYSIRRDQLIKNTKIEEKKNSGNYTLTNKTVSLPIGNSTNLESIQNNQSVVNSNLTDKPTVFIVDNNLTVTNYTCNGQGVFLVGGNLTITTELLNGNVNKDACIFIVKGDVIVTDLGVNSYYDSIHAYIFTDGKFIVQGQEDEGLFIEGGVHALNGFSLERYLNLENRLISPVVGVTLNSKYGVLGGKVFGSPLEIQKVEVGIKPY